MGKINISINKKIFTLFCQDGDEERISLAAKAFDQKLNDLRLTTPNTSSDLLMTICILETQDQLSESLKKNQLYDNEMKQSNINISEDIKGMESRLRSLTKKIQDVNLR